MQAPKTAKDGNLERRIYHLEGQLKWAIQASHAIVNNLDEVAAIKQALIYGDTRTAKQVWEGLDEDDQNNLMTAWTKGGAFSAKEREMVRDIWCFNHPTP